MVALLSCFSSPVLSLDAGTKGLGKMSLLGSLYLSRPHSGRSFAATLYSFVRTHPSFIHASSYTHIHSIYAFADPFHALYLHRLHIHLRLSQYTVAQMPPITIKAASQMYVHRTEIQAPSAPFQVTNADSYRLFTRFYSIKMDTGNTLIKRDNGSDRFSLYVFAIIVGCIAFVLIGCGIYSMYNGNDEEGLKDAPYEQRKYMHEVRQRNLNGLARTARRPDMIVPVENLNV